MAHLNNFGGRLFANVPERYQKPFATRWWNNKSCWTLTISPQPDVVETPEKVSKLELEIIYILLRVNVASYWLVPERTETGRLHWHGCVRPTKGAYEIRHMKELFEPLGVFVHTTQKAGKNWIEYCFKEFNLEGINSGIMYNNI